MSRAPNLPDHQDPRRPDGRREPLPGAMDDVVFRRAGPRSRKPASSWRWRWWLAAGIAALLLVGVLRQPLADRLWPQTRAQALRAQAAQALAQGRLTAPDGSGARERFDAALAIDPDRDEARAGLARVAVAALAQAREATRDNRFADAHAALRLARELSVPRADAARVEAGLREREAAHAGIAQLLATAAAARDGGHLDGDAGAALPIYQRVLALQPDNKPALEGREDALGDLLQDTRAQLRAGGVAQAAAAVAAARGYDPGHVDLPETEALLNEESDAIRRHAEADLRRGRLEAAAQGYRSLADAGARSQAEPGRAHVAAAYAQRAQRLAGDFRFADAGKALAQGRALAPKLAELDAAERHVARAQQAHLRLGSTLPPRERARRVARLLDEAAAAEARGELVTPPGDSAFDKLRAKALASVAHKYVRRWINLTGSPAPNGVVDLWGQMWFVDGGFRLGNSFDAYSKRFFRAVPGSDGYSRIEPMPFSQQIIEGLIKDRCITIDAKDWFDIKDPVERVVGIQLPPAARRQYNEMQKELFTQIRNGDKNEDVEAFNAGGKSNKCLQIASGNVYYDDKKNWVKVHDEKIEALRSIVEETNGEPLLVRYTYKPELERILAAFPRAKFFNDKLQTEEAWNRGEYPMLVTHAASAGHGSNLQDGGRILVDYSQGWDLEQDEQIIERIGPTRQLQSGHDRAVFRYRIVAEDTIEETAVLPRIKYKMSVQDSLKAAMKIV